LKATAFRYCLTIGLLAAWFSMLASAGPSELLVDARFVPAPPMTIPEYLKSSVDPISGYPFVRVTNPGSPARGDEPCGGAYCTHRYSSAQAWNADQTLLVISNGCHGLCFLDGQTYVPLFRRQKTAGCEWHPKNPDLMICVGGATISLWAPRTDGLEVIYATTIYRELRFGPSKGNPSRDGNRIVVRAATFDGKFDAFVFDIAARFKFPAIHLDELPGKNDACTISPLGTYAVCMQELPGEVNNAFIFSADGKMVQSWSEHHRPGHGDMTVDDDGDEVYVGISKSEPDKYHVIKRRLKDGVVTSLAPFGEGQHVSLRAVTKPQWAFVSYAGDPSEVALHPDWAPFAQEVIALRIDGSGVFRRIAQTRNAPYDYWSETHASPSPDGSQVIWSSNWGMPGGPTSDFVTRLSATGAVENAAVARHFDKR
jgi:hypothetical protein